LLGPPQCHFDKGEVIGVLGGCLAQRSSEMAGTAKTRQLKEISTLRDASNLVVRIGLSPVRRQGYARIPTWVDVTLFSIETIELLWVLLQIILTKCRLENR